MNVQSHNFSINIGEIPIILFFDDSDFLEVNKEIYFNFISEKEDGSINIDVEYIPLEKFELKYETDLESPKISFDSSKNIYQIYWNSVEGTFDMGKMKGKIRCTHHVGVNSFIRIVLSIILLKKQGFLVHASSLIRNQKGYIFPGKSGAGKTTITRLTPDSTLLSDEVSLIKKVDGEFRAYGTPFWGELAIGGENTSVSIDNVYFPVQDGKNYVKSIGISPGLEKLLPNVLFYLNDLKLEKELFELCFEFMSFVSLYELHFLPEPDFWRSIDDE